MTAPPYETRELRARLQEFLDQRVTDPITANEVRLGSYKFGVYAFFDYDREPIYVGQTAEGLSGRVRRHLTNQRTDAVAMKVLDPFEVFEVALWPLPQYQGRKTDDPEARAHLNWLEGFVFQEALANSQFHAVLNEVDPPIAPQLGFACPPFVRGSIVSDGVFELRNHPDTRIARRAETLSLLAKVINERQVQRGLRKTLLTQALRLAALAERRLADFASVPDEAEEPEKS